MNNIEKALGGITIAGALIGIGVSWNSLNNRIDKVDEKIGAIQKTLGSTTCNAILTRQIEAIEKNRAEPRKALEALSAQYDCLPRSGEVAAYWPRDAASATSAMIAPATNLTAQLNAIDVQLNKEN